MQRVDFERLVQSRFRSWELNGRVDRRLWVARRDAQVVGLIGVDYSSQREAIASIAFIGIDLVERRRGGRTARAGVATVLTSFRNRPADAQLVAATAQIHRKNDGSERLFADCGFEPLTDVDDDYRLWTIGLDDDHAPWMRFRMPPQVEWSEG